MKFYVAGKWQERVLCGVVIDSIRALGHEVTVDWTCEREVLEERVVALRDMEGVAQADVVIAILERAFDYKGAWVEIGAALGQGKQVWVVGNEGDSCIFLHHPLVRRFLDIYGALKYLRQGRSFQ